MRQEHTPVVDWVSALRQQYPEEGGVHILGIVEQPKDRLYLASSNSKIIVESVVCRCPIDLNIRAAELPQLVHMQLDSDSQFIGE
jgi:hypothetical protein